MKSRARASLAASCLMLLVAACDDKPSAGAKDTAPSARPSAAPPPTPTSTTPTLAIVVDDKRFTVNGDKVDLASMDPKSQIAGVLSGKAGIEGAVVDVVAMRDTMTPKVAMVVALLRAAKAQGVNVKTTRRDGTTASVAFSFGVARPECAAVGMIGKDGAITAWTVGGGTASRFSRGFAGPDLTLGSAGVRKLVQACDATVFYLSAADNITWGLTFDLALAVRGGEDGGAPLRAASATLLSEAPVPGRKVAAE